MLLTTRRQVCFSAPVILLAIGFYTSIYIQPYFHKPLAVQQNFEDVSSGLGGPNLAISLNPQDHVHRQPKTIHHLWNITSDLRTPDGVAKRVYLINGEFPGPVIEARSGDEIVVEVHNYLVGENTAIHWHGLAMRGANEMDGAVGLTQGPIRPSNKFTYKFKISIDQAGTFWYHAHSELQRADGLYGALIIHEAASSTSGIMTDSYDEDLALMVGDWYHRPAEEIRTYYTDWTNFGNEPAPDSLVINGKGAFNCSMAVPARPLECKHVAVPRLRISGKRARLRVINSGALTGFTLSMSGHLMTLLKIDGGNDVAPAPVTQSIGILYPGERIDTIVERVDVEEKNAELTIRLDGENLKFKNFALTETQHFQISPSTVQSETDYVKQPESFFNLADASGPTLPTGSIPSIVNQTFLLYTKVAILSEFGNVPKGFINRTSWDEPSSNAAPLLEISRTEWGDKFIPWIGPGTDKWVDIILNNMDDRGHPFHLHGYNFHVLATHKAPPGRYETYNPFDQASNPGGSGDAMNTLNPVKKDTVYVPRMGYVVLRFRADNEGLWLFHCHVLLHHAVGMAMAFQVGGDESGISKHHMGESRA